MTLKPANGSGPDNEFSPSKGNPQRTQGLTPGSGGGPGSTRWRYDVQFRQSGPGQPVLCYIDPVICIKDGNEGGQVGDPVCP
jgi:hypothetical protein